MNKKQSKQNYKNYKNCEKNYTKAIGQKAFEKLQKLKNTKTIYFCSVLM